MKQIFGPLDLDIVLALKAIVGISKFVIFAPVNLPEYGESGLVSVRIFQIFILDLVAQCRQNETRPSKNVIHSIVTHCVT